MTDFIVVILVAHPLVASCGTHSGKMSLINEYFHLSPILITKIHFINILMLQYL